jgi:hypothetical protein
MQKVALVSILALQKKRTTKKPKTNSGREEKREQREKKKQTRLVTYGVAMVDGNGEG